MATAKKVHRVFPVKFSKDEHETVARRAEAAGLSLQKYIVEITTTGKINVKRK